jgi:hypothetical protein
MHSLGFAVKSNEQLVEMEERAAAPRARGHLRLMESGKKPEPER